MKRFEFSWDPAKARNNKRKHAVSFEEAQTVFYDDNARLIYDPDHSKEEERFILLGMSATLRLLLVCHSYRGGESIIRIISARRASKTEQHQYLGSKP
jgi:uncharacterized protein